MATVKIGRASDREAAATQTAAKTYYVDTDGVPTTDPAKAAKRITAEGRPILPHIAAQYGFVDGDISKKEAAKLAKDAQADVAEQEADGKKMLQGKETGTKMESRETENKSAKK